MEKIKSLADLKKRREDLQSKIELREEGDNVENLVQIKVAMATCGIASGAKQTMEAIIEACKQNDIKAVVTQTGCMGYCYAEPTVEVKKPGQEPIVYGHVDTKKGQELVTKYIMQGEILEGVIPVNYEQIDNK